MDIETLFHTMDYGPAPESPASAYAWLDQHGRAFNQFIGNAWVTPAAKTKIDVHNPATGERLAAVSDANQEDIDNAVQAAREGFKLWSQLRPHDRARHIYAIARSVQKHDRLCAVVESLDNGKPIRESRDIDVPLGCPPFLASCGMGTAHGDRNEGLQATRGCWSNHSLEFPTANARVENCSGTCHGQYRGA